MVTKICDSENVEVTFPTLTSINKIVIQKETCYFEIHGKRASRKQFPLQNAFALTIHKTQGLTLPHVTLNVDENIFAEGQIYVAMSRAPSLKSLHILGFDYAQLKVSKAALEEYKRLEKVNAKFDKAVKKKIFLSCCGTNQSFLLAVFVIFFFYI